MKKCKERVNYENKGKCTKIRNNYSICIFKTEHVAKLSQEEEGRVNEQCV